MIIRCYGHHGLKQFIRAKSIEFGYKLWALCSVSGFCFHFSLYCRKESKEGPSTTPLGNRVIHKLLCVVEEPSSYVIFIDTIFLPATLFFVSYNKRDSGQPRPFETTESTDVYQKLPNKWKR